MIIFLELAIEEQFVPQIDRNRLLIEKEPLKFLGGMIERYLNPISNVSDGVVVPSEQFRNDLEELYPREILGEVLFDQLLSCFPSHDKQ